MFLLNGFIGLGRRPIAQSSAQNPESRVGSDKNQQLSLHDLKDKKAIVLVFFSFECPVSNSYCQPLVDMHKEYAKHGVAFIGLTVNDDDTAAHVAKQARAFNLTFPVFRDRGLAAARAWRRTSRPSALSWTGITCCATAAASTTAIRNDFKKHQQVTKHDLRQVIGELLSGRPVAEPATQAIGCPIVRDEPKVAKNGNVTYHKDVQPILQNHCQTCHRPGEVGPFSLLTYKQAVNWARTTSRPTRRTGPCRRGGRRRWRCMMSAASPTGRSPRWPLGPMAARPPATRKNAPPAREFTEGWRLGTPDLILSPTR